MSKIMLRVWTRLCRLVVLLFPIVTYAGPAEDYERGLKAYQEEDLIAAMDLLRRSADAGHTPAQVLLAYILDKSENDAQAFELYTQAAQKGDAEGQAGLADMYASGEGVEQDYDRALEWYKRAAENGSLRAMRVLAIAYLDGGLDLQPDAEKAIEWLNRAVALGDEEAKIRLREITQKGTSESGRTQP